MKTHLQLLQISNICALFVLFMDTISRHSQDEKNIKLGNLSLFLFLQITLFWDESPLSLKQLFSASKWWISPMGGGGGIMPGVLIDGQTFIQGHEVWKVTDKDQAQVGEISFLQQNQKHTRANNVTLISHNHCGSALLNLTS